ncbi:MAG: 5-formyltetrahydrofolate cyclo-ligase [Ruminococcus sp.]|nr:5-formyltetrahydrofolate cyclo-ligase [Ruminococcus sp.]
MTDMTDKKELRKHFSILRENSKTPSKDKLICEKLMSCGNVMSADVILMYASFGSEADTWTAAKELLGHGKTLAFPKCLKNGIMTFHIVSELEQLRSGKYGIMEPDDSLPQPVCTDNTVCIVPGLAFTMTGGRLGYGGGFYDRFLEMHPNIKTIALSYEALITSELPLQKHDLCVNSIITEERMIICNEK